jgi:hypothetical protein
MPPELYSLVLDHLRKRLTYNIRSHLALSGDVPLMPEATFFDYVIISQRRYWASSRARNPTNSLVAVSRGPGLYDVGELISIFALVPPVPGGVRVNESSSRTDVVRKGQVRFLRRVEEPYVASSAWSHT